jgi:hypothetical protein
MHRLPALHFPDNQRNRFQRNTDARFAANISTMYNEHLLDRLGVAAADGFPAVGASFRMRSRD